MDSPRFHSNAVLCSFVMAAMLFGVFAQNLMAFAGAAVILLAAVTCAVLVLTCHPACRHSVELEIGRQ